MLQSLLRVIARARNSNSLPDKLVEIFILVHSIAVSTTTVKLKPNFIFFIAIRCNALKDPTNTNTVLVCDCVNTLQMSFYIIKTTEGLGTALALVRPFYATLNGSALVIDD